MRGVPAQHYKRGCLKSRHCFSIYCIRRSSLKRLIVYVSRDCFGRSSLAMTCCRFLRQPLLISKQTLANTGSGSEDWAGITNVAEQRDIADWLPRLGGNTFFADAVEADKNQNGRGKKRLQPGAELKMMDEQCDESP